MSPSFFQISVPIREEIRAEIKKHLERIPHAKIRDIVMQRHSTSMFLKGTLAYLIHDGLAGPLTGSDKIRFTGGLEIFCSAGAILDNVIDRHTERNGTTTYLREYGVNMQLAASQFMLHLGLRLILPYLHNFARNFSERYKIDEAVLGMVGMDIEPETVRSIEDHLSITGMSNGFFNQVPLVMAASVATTDEVIIDHVADFGFNIGMGLAIYEEVRDLLGHHGRSKATELSGGRCIVPLYFAAKKDKSFKPAHFVGRVLSEVEYRTLIDSLWTTGALQSTANEIRSYFSAGLSSLRVIVDTNCYTRISALCDSVNTTTKTLISKIEESKDGAIGTSSP